MIEWHCELICDQWIEWRGLDVMVHKISRIKLVISWFVIMHRSFSHLCSSFFYTPLAIRPSCLDESKGSPGLIKTSELPGAELVAKSQRSLWKGDFCFAISTMIRTLDQPESVSFHLALRCWVSGLDCCAACGCRAWCAVVPWPVGLSFLSAHGIEGALAPMLEGNVFDTTYKNAQKTLVWLLY